MSLGYQLHARNAHTVAITGQVGAENVEALKEEVLHYFAGHDVFCVDLSGIKGFNTMLLAVLCAWARFAAQHHVALSFSGVSDGMQAIAELSQVDKVLFGQMHNKNKG